MRLLRVVLLMLFLLLAYGCETTDYYFTVENEKEVTGLLLYSDDHVTIFFMVYNGLISRLSVSLKKESEDVKAELVKYDHYLLVGGKKNIPSIEGSQGLGKIYFNENRSATIMSKLVFEEKPKSPVEYINVDILIDGRMVTITKEFPLQKSSFSRFEALMNI